MRVKNRILVLVTVTAALLLAGCGAHSCPTTVITTSGGGGGGTVSTGGNLCGSGVGVGGGPSAARAYYLDGTVEAANLGTNGSFLTDTAVTPPTEAGSGADDMIIVNGKFLYIPYPDINKVQAFTIDHSTGALTAIAGSPFALQSTAGADAVVSDPQGRFLFVGDEIHGTGAVSVFQINSTTGVLTEAPGSPFLSFGVFDADSMTVDGTGKFLYVAQGFFSAPVLAFSIDQNTGALSPVAGSPFAMNVAQIHADPGGKFLLGVQEVQDATSAASDMHIYVFAIDATTGAPILPGTSAATTGAPFDFTFSPNGNFVYLTEALNSAVTSIEGFQFDATTGNLTALQGSPFSSLPPAIQCKFDQGGGLMFCSTSGGGAFSVFTANPSTGGLTHTVTDLSVPSFPFAVTD